VVLQETTRTRMTRRRNDTIKMLQVRGRKSVAKS
jgi:hypothetical protein